MARGSGHKYHGLHNQRDRSESEDEENSRDRKSRMEEEEIRVSSQEKWKSSSKNNGVSRDHGKRRKVDDRWNGGREDDSRVEKESNKEGFDVLDLEKRSKSKSSGSRRQDGWSERNEEKRSEKESGGRESSISRYKDGKGKEKERVRERGSQKDKEVYDSKYERSDDRDVKQGVEISELHDDMRKPEVEKELDRQNRQRDGYSDRVDDRKESDDQQAFYIDDCSKNGSYKDGRYREKYREDLDRDQRHGDDKRRDERSTRIHTSVRSESKHYKDENKMSESQDKKTKLQDSDCDGSHLGDDYSTKFKDMRGRKISDKIEAQNDVKLRSAKEPHKETTENNSSSSNLDSLACRVRLEHSQIDKVDSSLSNSRTKNSRNNSVYVVKDQNRHSPRRPEHTHRESLSGDVRRSGAVSRDYMTSSGGRDRMPESQSSDKAIVKDNIHSDVLMSESHHNRIPISDTHTSPNQLTEKSPSTNYRRSKRSTARHNLDVEEGGQRNSSSRCGREQEYHVEKPDENDTSQEISKGDHVSLGPSSNHTSRLQGNSSGRLPPPPPNRFGANSPSVLGSYEDETRIQNGDPKINARYKRSCDASVGRGPGIPRKSSTPTWPSPVENGLMPLQHGPPPSFHPVITQFTASTLCSGRPPMDLNNNSYHIHQVGNTFPGHVPRPYGWHNSVDDHPPHSQTWDGNPNVFTNEWDQNRLLMSSRGWEMSTGNIWRGHNGNVSMEFPPVPQKEHEYSWQSQVDETWNGQFGNHSSSEQARSEQPIADGSGIKPPSDISPAKQPVGASSKSISGPGVVPELSKIPSVKGISETHSDDNVSYCSTYLSKLDISPDLLQPDLYKQCMSLFEAVDRHVTHNVSNQGRRKNNVECFRLVAKRRRYDFLFPTASDATFQKAMSLYRKQEKGMKAVTPLALPLCSQSNPPESKEGEKAANTLLGDYMEEDKDMAAIVEGDVEVMRCDKPVDAEETGCDKKLSDAVVFIERSEESEAKMLPECRENISRIHLFPESTH